MPAAAAAIIHPDTLRKSDRVPPGQKLVSGWPVLTAGQTPFITKKQFFFTVGGLVENPLDYSWDQFVALPSVSMKCDLHCVTTWSRLDQTFRGVLHTEILKRCKPRPEARFALILGEPGYSTNVPMADFARPDTMFTYEHEGAPLPVPHGGPLRDLIPHLYLWKSSKWATGVEFLAEDKAGFWEERGYHMRGDPWKEERYRDDAVNRKGLL
ncbi:MAG: sulfite oxidase-like oxidoreductase [Planctomycetota bacterium]|mgnify:CR=1 FL=1